ncbi:MAG: aconitate hydratase, partial [Acidisphaera sp.]|nr:aconitate hydratase [Acidisphaera sp.]
MQRDSFATRRQLAVGDARYTYFSLPDLARATGAALDRLPFSLRVLLENLLRNEDGITVSPEEIRALAAWSPDAAGAEQEVAFYPARVLMPDSSGVPLLVDLAALRDA